MVSPPALPLPYSPTPRIPSPASFSWLLAPLGNQTTLLAASRTKKFRLGK